VNDQDRAIADSLALATPLDRLLDQLAPFGPELSNGLTNHAPMVVECLCAFGRTDEADTWLASYRDLLLPSPPATQPIATAAYDAALGHATRYPDWALLFASEIAADGPPAVLRRWLPRLLPGLSGAATHGVIRLGHAARSLSFADTPARRHELAAALAYWASTFRALPLAAGAGTRDVGMALRQVPFLPAGLRELRGSIDAALAPLATWTDFQRVAAAFDPGDDARAATRSLSLLFARVYLTNAVDWLTTIVFVHALTSVKAVERLLPWLEADAARDAVRFAWQAAAALYAVYGTEPPGAPLSASPDAPASITAAAIASQDEHAIKVTETCLDDFAADPRPEFLAVSRHAITMLTT
jgi:hypothetical protein